MKILKWLLLSIFMVVIEACTYTNELNADLGIVFDKTELWYKNDKDSLGGLAYTRLLKMYYNAINTNNDSIFIPLGGTYANVPIATIDSHPTLKTTFYGEQCSKRGKGFSESCRFASGDSISFFFILRIGSPITNNDKDNEWLQKIPSKDLLTKLSMKMELKPLDNPSTIPCLKFNIDTTNISINPEVSNR